MFRLIVAVLAQVHMMTGAHDDGGQFVSFTSLHRTISGELTASTFNWLPYLFAAKTVDCWVTMSLQSTFT